MLYLLYLPVLLIVILVYFRLAVQYHIIDQPNHRSSHKRRTIRGGGILFPIAFLIQFFISGFAFPLFIQGLLLISLISFYDDIQPLSSKIRLLGHLTAVSLLFTQAGLMGYPLWLLGICYILVIGTINAYNFMDGINGITGSYSLLTIVSLYLLNKYVSPFILSEWLFVSMMALLVFNFFNFRQRAKCFAGDVGSVSIAFIIIFFLLLLILKTEEFKYIGLLLFYGLDAVTTIVFRLIRRENIFEAHRGHFYQYLVNVKNWPHLQVSALYLFAQMLVNVLIWFFYWNAWGFLIFVILSGIVFVWLRLIVEGKNYLIGGVNT